MMKSFVAEVTFNLLGCVPLFILFMTRKERHNLCMNRASLDFESLRLVS